MAWTTPKTFVGNDILTAAELNIYLRDNLLETEAAKASTLTGIMVSSGLNSIVERVGASQVIDDSEATTSTTYTNLTTVGPTVTVTTGTRAFYFLTAEMKLNTTSTFCNMTVEVSGKTTLPAADAGSLSIDGITEDKSNIMGICNFLDELTPGENTFTCKYKVQSGSTATFSNRTLTVIPF